MNYVILDLEWNGGYSAKMNGYVNEIIEFGAVKLDETMQIIGQFSMLVKPKLTKRLRSWVRDLTALTNKELEDGDTFLYALSKFRAFAAHCVLMTWSTSDLTALQSNCRCYGKNGRLPFIKQYVDLQMYCQEMLGINDRSPVSLAAAAERLALDIKDIPLHRAIGDCIISAKCLQKLYSKGAMKAHIRQADCDAFYHWLSFHNTYLCNMENPLIDKTAMYLNCGICGARADRLTSWESKNRAFYAAFACPHCGCGFKGKIMFRLKADGMTVVKKILYPADNAEQQF